MDQIEWKVPELQAEGPYYYYCKFCLAKKLSQKTNLQILIWNDNFQKKIIQLNNKEHSLTLVAKNVTVGQKIVWNWNEKKKIVWNNLQKIVQNNNLRNFQNFVWIDDLKLTTTICKIGGKNGLNE